MDLTTLKDADRYASGHIVFIVRDLVLAVAAGAKTLAQALEAAWQSGFSSCETERQSAYPRSEPTTPALTRSRTILRDHAVRSNDEYLVKLASVEWEWDKTTAAWRPKGSDFMLRPSCTGEAVILMEAGGEYSGTVLTEAGSFIFPDGTFA